MESGAYGPERPPIADRAHRLLLSLSIALLALGGPPGPRAEPGPEPEEPWRVVLIRNWDSQYATNIAREKTLREALLANAPRVVDIYAEELDPLRFFSEDTEREYRTYLAKKYRDRRIDVVIASGPEPLDFAARFRDLIWPGAAIVFNGVLDGTLDAGSLPRRTTGLTMVFDVAGTLDLGRAVRPEARTVYFVAGEAPSDRTYLAYALDQAKRSHPELEPRVIGGVARAEMLAQVGNAPPDSLVFYLSVLRDVRGQITPPAGETLAQMARRSPVPVLSAVHTQFKQGPLGGSSASIEAHGRATGLLARRILEGADPDRLPVRADPAPDCEVDWNAMRRWSIASGAIPERCAIANQPPPLWQAYFWPVFGLLAIIVLQAGLIWALALQRKRRIAAEAAARARGAEIAHFARLSTVGALTASIAHEINQPMGAILSNADAAQMMLEQGTLDVPKLREILADIRDEDLRASEVIRGLRKLLARREPEAVALELNSEVAEALRHLAFEAARRRVRLVPLFDGATPRVLGSSVQLQQVLINLVMNAMEAVATEPEREREVRIETHARAGGAEVVVADRGPGIAPGEASRIFDSMFTTKKEGMGLGLSIVRMIVEMHGGRVTYEPNAPRGALFHVWLPSLAT
ncbi:MAG TPA: ATP-binding protein [Usitatibacter sp.]|nr:ATP-binding protein [Usitatibacter sp.]